MKSWNDWKDEGLCRDIPTERYFEDYEEDLDGLKVRKDIDALCRLCPVLKECFAVAKYQKAWGVWGGIYMEDGETSEEFNNHKTPDDWAKLYGELAG